MDLNIENYSIDELFTILDINIKESNDLNYDFLYNKLQTKISTLRSIDSNELGEISENKALLVDFFYQCFIKLNNSIEKKQKNNVITQDNHNIIKHKESVKEEYYQVNYKSGTINPLTIKTFKNIINIDTRFRDNYENTTASDFTISLPLKKVLSIQVVNYQLPYTVYSISKKSGSNCFYVNNTLIELTNGGYDEDSLVEEINTKLNTLNTINTLNIQIS